MLDNLKLLFIWAPVMNVQLILDGIFIGAVFALTAYGLALVWGVMNIKNLAQGDFVIMGGYISFALFNAGFHPLLTLPLAMILMFGFGWIVYVIIIRRVIDKDMFTSLLATFGLSLLMQQVINLIFGPEVQTVDADFKIDGTPGKQKTLSTLNPGAPLVGFKIKFAFSGIQHIFCRPSLNSPGL